MTGHPVLTFALLICGSVLLLLAFIALVWALGKLWDALRGLNLRTLIWRWRQDASWRAAEREQARADAAETCERIILLAAACAPTASFGGDSRGAALAAQWAIADAAKRAIAEQQQQQTMPCACGGTIHLAPDAPGDWCDRCGPDCNAQTRPDDWRAMEAAAGSEAPR